MNGVFLSYNTSFFDLLNTDALLPSYGSSKIIKSSGGKLVESALSIVSDETSESIYTTKNTLGFGEKRAFTPDFNRIQIGYWPAGTIGYPEFDCDIYPTTTFHHGLKFVTNPVKYNDSDLWVQSGSGALKCRDRNVALSDDGVVAGNFAFFGSNPGVLNDNLVGFDSGLVVLTLYSNVTDPSSSPVSVDFDYQKIGKCVTLTLRDVRFQGSLYNNPSQFESRDTSGLLPTFLKPAREVACPLIVYETDSDRAAIPNQVGLLKIGGDIGGVVDLGNVEIRKEPLYEGGSFNASTGLYDGWSSCSISYFTS